MKPNTSLPTNLPKTWALLVTAAAALFAGSAYAAPPTPISSCGTVISAAGNYFLAQNLTCPGASRVIIAASKVDLDLKGFTIDGGGGSGFGISTSSGQMSSTADLSLCLAVTNIHIHSGTIKGYGRTDSTAVGAGIILCSPNPPPGPAVAMSTPRIIWLELKPRNLLPETCSTATRLSPIQVSIWKMTMGTAPVIHGEATFLARALQGAFSSVPEGHFARFGEPYHGS